MPSGVYLRTNETRRKMSLSKLGKPSNSKGHVVSVNGKQKISLAHKGKPLSEEHKNKLRNRIFSEETKRKIKEARARQIITPEHRRKIGLANRGKKCSEETKRKQSEAQYKYYSTHKSSNLGIKRSDETKLKISLAQKGEKGSNWKGGITPLTFIIRFSKEYIDWRNSIFKRDNYTCVQCQSQRDLEADHICPFNLVFNDFLKYYNQFSPVEDKEILTKFAIEYEPFWDIDNGRTLCKKCHKKTETFCRKRKE